MNSITDLVIRLYSFLLRLYPSSFRSDFEEQMLLDFSDLVVDASQKGILNLFAMIACEFCDLLISVFYAGWKESSMSPNFRPEAGKEVLRIMFAFGLALALNTIAGIIAFIDYDHLIKILRFMHSIGWQGTYKDIQPLLLNLSALMLGPLIAASLLLIIFPELRPIKKYMPASALVFALPALLSSTRLVALNHFNSTMVNTVFSLCYFVLIGLGFGILASLISNERKKLLGFLLIGVIGYFLVNWVSASLILSLPHGSTSFWHGVVSVAIRNGVIGMVMGLLLGLILEFRRPTHSMQVST